MVGNWWSFELRVMSYVFGGWGAIAVSKPQIEICAAIK
jgi:hypothetical protein